MIRTQGRIAALRRLGARGRQAIWALAEYFAYPAMMLVATPFLLRFLGSEQYGQYLMLLTFNGLGGITGLGMGTAVVKEVSDCRGRGDLAGAARAARSGLAVTLASVAVLGSVLLGIGLIAGPALLARMGDPGTIRLLFVGAVALIALEQLDLVFASTLRGAERFDLSAHLEVISKSAIVAAAVAAAWWWSDLRAVIATTLLLTVLRCAIKAVIATRLLGQGPLLPRWYPVEVRRIFAFGIWTWAQSIGAALFGTADRLLIGGHLGADALARYSVCLQLAQQVAAIPAAAAQVLLPYVSRAQAEGSRQVRTIAIRAMIALCAVAGGLALVLILFGHTILRLWVGSDFAATGAPILAILAIAFAVLAINNVPHFVLLGLNRSRFVALVNLGAGFAALGATWLALRSFELNGAAYGRLAYAVMICLLIVEMFKRLRGPSAPNHRQD